MADIKERIAGIVLAGGMAVGGPAMAQPAQSQTRGPSAAQIEQTRVTSNTDISRQVTVAEQTAGFMFNMKDKGAFDILNKSVVAKASGQASDPVQQMQSYLSNKQKGIDGFIQKREQESERARPGSVREASSEEIAGVLDKMRAGNDQRAWSRDTEKWDKSSFARLKERVPYALQADKQEAAQAASLAATVNDPQMLKVLAGVRQSDGKPESVAANQALRQDISKIGSAQLRDVDARADRAIQGNIAEGQAAILANRDAQTREAELLANKATEDARARIAAAKAAEDDIRAKTESLTAATVSSVLKGRAQADGGRTPGSQPSGQIPADLQGPRMSGVDCKAQMNDCAKGGTTVSAGGRLTVSPAEIQMTAKTMVNMPREKWPNLDNWDRSSLRALKNDVSQESANQVNMARQAISSIQAGGDSEALTRNIANPDVKNAIVTRASANMPAQDAAALTKEMTDNIRSRRDDIYDAIKSERSDVSAERDLQRELRRAPATGGAAAPGS